MIPHFPQLNLPTIECDIKVDDAGRCRVLCLLRRRWVTLTPEEWVRQHFVAWLISRGYPRSLMANEVPIILNGMSRRCDTVVWDHTAGRPLAIIEYKAPTVQISDNTVSQAARYNLVLGAPLLIVSNGLRTLCLATLPGQAPRYLTALPNYSALEAGEL